MVYTIYRSLSHVLNFSERRCPGLSRAIIVINLWKLVCKNLNIDLVDINATFDRNLYISTQDVEQKRNSDINQGP